MPFVLQLCTVQETKHELRSQVTEKAKRSLFHLNSITGRLKLALSKAKQTQHV